MHVSLFVEVVCNDDDPTLRDPNIFFYSTRITLSILRGPKNPAFCQVFPRSSPDAPAPQTGRIYVMLNILVQAGFILGPVLGNGLVEVFGFEVCSDVLGGFLLVYAVVPLLLVYNDEIGS